MCDLDCSPKSSHVYLHAISLSLGLKPLWLIFLTTLFISPHRAIVTASKSTTATQSVSPVSLTQTLSVSHQTTSMPSRI